MNKIIRLSNSPDNSNIIKWELGILIILGILVSLIYYYPILNSGDNLGIQDWDENFAWTESSRVSLLEYHQFPLWSPYKCGGAVQFANPEIPVVSFQTLFALLFGTMRGIKFSIFFHGLIGFLGFYLLARQYKLSYLGSLLASILFSFSGITGSFLSTGMVVFTSFAYTPYILFFFNKSLKNGKWGFLCGTLFALSFYSGYHIPLLLGVYILIYALVMSIGKHSLTPFKALFIMLSTSALISLPKLILSIQLIRALPRLMSDVSGYSIRNFFYFLLSQKQNLFNEMDIKGFYFAIDENSLYVGVLSFFLFLLFFANNKQGIKQNICLLFSLLIMVWIMLGYSTPLSLYSVMKHLPVFSSFRVAQRFRFDFIIPFSLLTGLGLDNLVRLLRTQKLALPVAILCLLVIYVDLASFSTTNFLSKTLIIKNPASQLLKGTAFLQRETTGPEIQIQRTIPLPDKFLDSRIFTPWSNEYLVIQENKGILKCYDCLTTTTNAKGVDDIEYQGEYHLLTPVQDVEVRNTYWSPNKLVFQITHAEKALKDTLIINQNYFPGWIVRTSANTCKRAIYSNGLLATKLDSGTDHVSFEFNPFLRWFRCRD